MDTTINIRLSGHSERFEFDEGAYKSLTSYLDRAGSRLEVGERAEVLGDLEQSVGDRLIEHFGTHDRIVTVGDIDRVLDEIGPVETEREPVADQPPPQPRPRRLQRVREGQQIAGVCTGIAAYSELEVDWVRTFFILGTLVTAGVLGLVYCALAFALPVAATGDARN